MENAAPPPPITMLYREPCLDYPTPSSVTSDTMATLSPTRTDSTTSPPSDILVSPSSLFLQPASPQTQSPLMRSPFEIIHKVLTNSGAEDLPALARTAKTCRKLRSFIFENPDNALWRDIHLRRYDDPRTAGAFVVPREEFDWRNRVQDREFVSRIFREWGKDRFDELPNHVDLICSTLLDMYLDLPPSSSPESESGDTDPSFLNPFSTDDPINAPLLTSILRSDTFLHIYHTLSMRETRSLLRPLRGQQGNPHRRVVKEILHPDLSRLHVLLAPEFDRDDPFHRQQRGNLREVVYSSGNFTESNDWGPFTPEGKVDWTLVDAIGSVMMANAKDVIAMGEDSWRQAVLPMSYGLEPVRGLGFNDLRRPVELGPDDIWDWAGVEGTWCGSYAFLDYADWISLNEPRLVLIRRSVNQLDLSRYNEAIGDLMRLELAIDGKPDPSTSFLIPERPLEGLPEITTHLPTSDLLPPIYFHGSSVQENGALTYPAASQSSFVRGVVRLTADDPPQVRWTLVIRYGGEDRWRLECVQVGGRCAKRGFFGIWTDAAKEEHSPNGPVWYWKT